ncbi:MAG: adenylate kinase [Fidelibacterota bacterium]
MRMEVMGAPGSGKGTQARMLAKKFGIPHVSTGDMFRENVLSGTSIGREAGKILQRGELVPDDLVTQMIAERLGRSDCDAGYLLDGYPRTMSQLEALDAYLVSRGWNRSAVLFLEVPDEEIVRRISGRRNCPHCGPMQIGEKEGEAACPGCGARLQQRNDDREEVLRKRLEVYRRQTAPLLAVYRQRKLLLEIDGVGAEAKVLQRICTALDGEAA